MGGLLVHPPPTGGAFLTTVYIREFLAEAGTEGPELLYADINPRDKKYVTKAERNPFWVSRKLALYQDITSTQLRRE